MRRRARGWRLLTGGSEYSSATNRSSSPIPSAASRWAIAAHRACASSRPGRAHGRPAARCTPRTRSPAGPPRRRPGHRAFAAPRPRRASAHDRAWLPPPVRRPPSASPARRARGRETATVRQVVVGAKRARSSSRRRRAVDWPGHRSCATALDRVGEPNCRPPRSESESSSSSYSDSHASSSSAAPNNRMSSVWPR